MQIFQGFQRLLLGFRLHQVFSSNNSDGTLASYSLNFEQHASVSVFEEVGMNILGFDIVNVAQQVTFNFKGNQLAVTGATDIFPSATLSGNGSLLFKYNQPSFINTHRIILKQIGANAFSSKHLRPFSAFYKR